MHDLSSFVVDVLPGVTLLVVGFLAALPPYLLLRQSSRGRARSAVSYLCGLATGAAATGLFAIASQLFDVADAILQAGLFSSFFCPFVGMARALWDRPRSKARRLTVARTSLH